MPYISQESGIDIDPYDFLSECSQSEKNELAKYLKSELFGNSISINEEQFNKDIKVISESYFKLSPDDIRKLNDIAIKL